MRQGRVHGAGGPEGDGAPRGTKEMINPAYCTFMSSLEPGHLALSQVMAGLCAALQTLHGQVTTAAFAVCLRCLRG